MTVGETIVEKWVQLLNESLIHLFKRQVETYKKSRAIPKRSMSFNGCQIYRAEDHMVKDYPKYATSRHKCLKCGGLHKIIYFFGLDMPKKYIGRRKIQRHVLLQLII
jgi:hypothetical protein